MLRLCPNIVDFFICDPTKIERKESWKTDYVGNLGEKLRGYWNIILSFPFKGRAIPFCQVLYSSSTLNSDLSSRNIEHNRILSYVKELVGDIPIIFDREFSYLTFLADFVAEGMNFVIRLNRGNRAKLYDANKREVELSLSCGSTKTWGSLYYKGEIKVNVVGYWGKGFKEPVFLITTLEPEKAKELYKKRMLIEECFKDMKSQLNFHKSQCYSREKTEKLNIIAFIAYAISLIIGEKIREANLSDRNQKKYSGLFVFLHFPFDVQKLEEPIKEGIKLLKILFQPEGLLEVKRE